ncbi:MAG TPA: peptidylprolyl isomerase [Ferruginibacter sp.]|nr:peptidylprolyl isomerase [Ferruginibacter sp.]HMP19790.1 peptidylprolyl isomerase [Ferruginibacter sp.]
MKLVFKISAVLIIVLFTSNTRAQVKPVKRTTHKRAAVQKKPGLPKTNVVKPLPAKPEGMRVKIKTDMGDIIVRLYDKTPLHRDNFIKLVKDHFYDSLLFHRVINAFMIQGGDPNSKQAPAGAFLGGGDVGYTIPAEFDSTLYHKRGALCAARDNNPAKASSGCQFYIVQGRPYNDGELDMISQRNNIFFSSAKRMTYKMNGGTPFLDMNYTVFGEVESGMDTVDKIAQAAKDGNNRPASDIRMYMELIDENTKEE